MPSLDSQTSAIALLAWDLRSKAAVAKGLSDNVMDYLHAQLPHDLARRVYTKAAVGAGTTTDSVLGQSAIAIGPWTDAAGRDSAFYRIANEKTFAWQPWYSRIAYATNAPTASVVNEGAAIPVSKITFNYVTLIPQKVADLFPVSAELLFRVDAAGQASFNRMLLARVSSAVDNAFAAKISSGLTPIASTGALADIRAAMLAVTSHQKEVPYWLASSDVAKLASTLSDAKGGNPFAGVRVSGGELAGAPLLVSAGLASGSLLYLDASQIAANAEVPTVGVSKETSLQEDTAPTMDSSVPTATTTVSMYGTDTVAVIALAYVASQPIRANAVSLVTGITGTTWAP